MSDAWDTLVAVSSTGDAWERLNDITGEGNVAGTSVNEIPFTLSGVTNLTASLSVPTLNISTSPSNILATIVVHETTTLVTPENITIMESC